MKIQVVTALLAALASASPVIIIAKREPLGIVDKRQSVGTTENEFTLGGCRDIIFFFARGSTEVGNMGESVGPPTGSGLKQAFGDARVAVEGVDYAALLSTNFVPGGADPAGVAEMHQLFIDAATRCPNAKLVGGGYSQGAALTHRAIENLPQTVKDKIVAVVTYGDTQNLQDNGQIPNFPKSKLLIICNVGDAVCAGTLTILPEHLDYVRRVPEAVSFLVSKLKAAGA